MADILQEDVFDAVIKWIDADRNERKKHSPMLMNSMHLSLINEEVC